MNELYRYQVRTNNKSNRIVRKYKNFNEIPYDHDDIGRFLDMICDGLESDQDDKLKWVIAK